LPICPHYLVVLQHEDLTLRESGEKLISDDTPRVVNAASTIPAKIRREGQKGKGSKGPRSPPSRDSKKPKNPKTKEYVEKKVRESNGKLTASEVYKWMQS
jgi:hypothetical protein